MDPLPPIPMIPPPTTTTSAAANHIANVANPTPHQPPPIPRHPPYTEMIMAAIITLKDKKGSSKQAISKYIYRMYSNLPPTHSSLLSHHLQRLKNNGQLIMVKHSYKLPPRSVPFPTSSFLNTINNVAVINSSTTSPPGQPKKGPGRPTKPKPKPIFLAQDQNSVGLIHPPQIIVPFVEHEQNNNVNFAVGPTPLVQKRKTCRPSKPKPAAIPIFPHVAQNKIVPSVGQSNGVVVGSESVFVPLGLADRPATATPVKRRARRPRKEDSVGPHQARPNPVGQVGQKRRLGRPPKNGPVGVGLVGPVNRQPKIHGRQPKNARQTLASVANVFTTGSVVPNVGTVVPHVEASVAVPYVQTEAQAPIPVGGGVYGFPPSASKRCRRPSTTDDGSKNSRKFSGTPLGRPKKSASAPNASQHLTAYLNLKSKLEYLQSRIKETVSVLKPYLNNETSVNAMGALQQLEDLATADVSAPFNVRGQ